MTNRSLLEMAHTELKRSAVDKRHPFRQFVFATIDPVKHTPEVRTVITRGVADDLTITFYTHSLSPKVAQVENNDHTSALFWHPRKKLQVRMLCEPELVHEDSAHYQKAIDRIRASNSISDYVTKAPPGTPLDARTSDSKGEMQVSVIRLFPVEMDILLLDRKGHLRCKYYRKKADWQEVEVVP